MTQNPPFAQSLKKQTLAEQVAEAIKESILAGEWEPGAALPTEPELAEAFGVSRAVVRDATRMLAARGLVEAQHGRGVFVTESQVQAFGEALLLALRRAGATAWDVEQFEQIVYPELFALAASEATDEELAHIGTLADAYLAHREEQVTEHWGEDSLPPAAGALLMADYRAFVEAIFAATHNKLLQLLARPLVSLRSSRNWEAPEQTLAEALAEEAGYIQTILNILFSRDPEMARAQMREVLALPPEAVAAMRQTPVGQESRIPPINK
ncbi:MAG: FadR family transcriptional regulator [Ardenticatenaceae bacterium]|nr:FadR family transcriptional regulator [Ardenticatenaceae bacterium]MCB8987641.1 FadR family transcriptional regulator [Ardenticatenaceae bacterium]